MQKETFRLSTEFKEKIIQALESRNAPMSCPMCGNKQFNVADGLIAHVWQKASTNLSVTGSAVICAVIICNNCGFLSEHSLGALGLLEEFDKYDEQEKIRTS